MPVAHRARPSHIAILIPLALLITACGAPRGFARETIPEKVYKEERRVAVARLGTYMDTVHRVLPERVQRSLARIPNVSRRLLAMKYYLHRDEEEINRKWAWTEEEAREYRKSDEYKQALEEVAGVRQAFARLNPGYQLQVDLEIRSLSSQIGKWNSVRSIGEGADELMKTALAFIADSLATPVSENNQGDLARFLAFLHAFEPKRHPTVAVPGLSQHGQLRAFDFRVSRGGRVIAGASTSSIRTAWDDAGWTAKLCEAILAVSPKFEGPLLQPYEPWHYEYRP